MKNFLDKLNAFGVRHADRLFDITMFSIVVGIGCGIWMNTEHARMEAVRRIDLEFQRQESLPAPESGEVELRGIHFRYKVVVIDGAEYLATRVEGGWALCPKTEHHEHQ